MILAILPSIFWGFNGILLRKGFEKADVLSGTITVVGISYFVVSFFSIFRFNEVEFPPLKIAILALAGIISYTFGRLFTYSSLTSIGSSRAFSGTSTRILFSSILGMLALGEEMSLEIALGTILMILGLYIFSTEKISAKGLAYSIIGGFAYGFAAILIKLGMLKSAIVSLFISSSFGFSALYLFVGIKSSFKPVANRYLIASGFSLALGNISYYLALSQIPVIIVVPLSNMYPLVTTFLSYLLIKDLERVRFRTLVGSALTVFGSTIIACS